MTRKGEHHSEETKKKMRESSKKRWSKPEEHIKGSNTIKEYYKTHEAHNKGKHLDEETKRKIGEKSRKRWQETPHPMLGKTHTLAAREKISRTHKGKIISEETKRKMSDGHKRYYSNPKNREKQIEIQKQTIKNHPKLLQNLYKGGWTSKKGYRKDLNQCFRSKWEANFARIMRYENEPYIYEDRKFKLDDGSIYIPDFYLPYIDWYIEIKGYWYERGHKKVVKFLKKYPKENLIIVGEDMYKYLINKYQRFIKNWEN